MSNNEGASQPEATRPVALLFSTDLMFGVQLQNMARAGGFKHITVRPGAPLPPGDLLIVDLAARGDWETAIREAAARGTRIIAFGPHIDAASRKRAKDAGAERVLANSNLARDLPGILKEMHNA
ncbi:MAG: hypothetical protein ACJ78Q_20015 [Chloroflexia bacterium]